MLVYSKLVLTIPVCLNSMKTIFGDVLGSALPLSCRYTKCKASIGSDHHCQAIRIARNINVYLQYSDFRPINVH